MLNVLKRVFLVKNNLSFVRYDSGKAMGLIYDENNSREMSNLTNIDIINHETEKTYFKSYSEIGFTMSNNFKIIGACAALPKTVLFWNVLDIEDVNEESLELVSILEPKLDLLIIGKGPRNAKPDYKTLLQLSKKLNINFEILPTVDALATFNFLNYEDRNVAAFLLPAKSFAYYDEDKEQILKIRNRRMDLLTDSQADIDPGNVNLDSRVFIPRQIAGSMGKPNRVGDALKEIISETDKSKLLENTDKISETDKSKLLENTDKKDKNQIE